MSAYKKLLILYAVLSSASVAVLIIPSSVEWLPWMATPMLLGFVLELLIFPWIPCQEDYLLHLNLVYILAVATHVVSLLAGGYLLSAGFLGRPTQDVYNDMIMVGLVLLIHGVYGLRFGWWQLQKKLTTSCT